MPSTPARRIAFRVEYDGTGYSGWQSQPNLPRTIQHQLELAISEFVRHDCSVQGASRTDAGVHAADQLAAVTIEHPAALEGFTKAVNVRLPKQISIREPVQVADDYNPRFENQGKTYQYRVYRSYQRCPLKDRYAWRIPWALDTKQIERATHHLVGTYDFTSFAAVDGNHQSPERTITQLQLAKAADVDLNFVITGTAFMRNMVRILVGTLVEVGRGRLSPDDILTILHAKDRQKAGPTAPANGLCLHRIYANFENLSLPN